MTSRSHRAKRSASVPDDYTFGSFDFGLTSAEENRARRLHQEAIVIDILHMGPCSYRSFSASDSELLLETWKATLDPNDLWMAAKGIHAQQQIAGLSNEFRACLTESGLTAISHDLPLRSPSQALRVFGAVQAQFDHLPWFRKALTASDITRAKTDHVHAAFLNTQDTEWFGRDLSMLRAGHELGLRMAQLTYNSTNLVGGGCTDHDAGLSRFGQRVVAEMNTLGMIVDTSHCGRRTTLDACSLSQSPVVASHTSAETIYQHDRAKSDDELDAIAATGGVVGVYAMPPCLGVEEALTVDGMLDHLDYLVDRIGIDHVGIGADWPMSLPKWALRDVSESWARSMGFRPEHNLDDERNLIGFDDCRDIPNVTRGLVKRGYSDESIKKTLGDNFLRVFERICG